MKNYIHHVLGVLLKGGKIIFAGNGGSFGDAQHLSTEFVSKFRLDRSPLNSIALGTNSSTISAVANDFDMIKFSQGN